MREIGILICGKNAEAELATIGARKVSSRRIVLPMGSRERASRLKYPLGNGEPVDISVFQLYYFSKKNGKYYELWFRCRNELGFPKAGKRKINLIVDLENISVKFYEYLTEELETKIIPSVV